MESSGDRKERLVKLLINEPFSLPEEKVRGESLKLYVQAILHSSLSNELNAKRDTNIYKSYRRLAFLGDAVIEISVREHLYRTDQIDEKHLTLVKQRYVSREDISKSLKKKNIDKELIELCLRSNNIGNNAESEMFEALVGAVYLEEGYKKAEDIVKKILII
ncbi:MAG: ribonuclease III domain-containing protein [Methanomassiliicoccaceae archaeon]|nr:ribonuclease III domain-containing protein [Methanomassiliicoccaceae archaeon]